MPSPESDLDKTRVLQENVNLFGIVVDDTVFRSESKCEAEMPINRSVGICAINKRGLRELEGRTYIETGADNPLVPRYIVRQLGLNFLNGAGIYPAMSIEEKYGTSVVDESFISLPFLPSSSLDDVNYPF